MNWISIAKILQIALKEDKRFRIFKGFWKGKIVLFTRTSCISISNCSQEELEEFMSLLKETGYEGFVINDQGEENSVYSAETIGQKAKELKYEMFRYDDGATFDETGEITVRFGNYSLPHKVKFDLQKDTYAIGVFVDDMKETDSLQELQQLMKMTREKHRELENQVHPAFIKRIQDEIMEEIEYMRPIIYNGKYKFRLTLDIGFHQGEIVYRGAIFNRDVWGDFQLVEKYLINRIQEFHDKTKLRNLI